MDARASTLGAALDAALDAALATPAEAEALVALCRDGLAWSLGYARLQGLLQGSEPGRAARLASALATADPARAARVAAAQRRLGALGTQGKEMRVLSAARARGVATPPQYVRLSQLAKQAGDVDSALALLEEAVDRHPDSALARIERGKAHHVAGNAALAQQDARASLEMPTVTIDIALGAADLLHAHGATAEAAAALRAVVPRLPPSALLLGRAAQLASWAGDTAAAAELSSAAIAAAPDEPQPELRLRLARLFAATGRPEEALALLRPLRAATPLPEVEAVAAECLMPLLWRAGPEHADEAALAELLRAIAEAGNAMAADRAFEATRILLLLDRQAEARRMVGTATRLRLREGDHGVTPQLAALLRDLALLAPNGRPGSEAPPMAPAALARELVRQGLAQLPTGRAGRAALCFEAAMALDPDDPAARFNAAFAALAEHRITDAALAFEGPTRIYDPDMARVAWPQDAGVPWPLRGPGSDAADAALAAAFAALLPDGRDWPTITVITPSYNQAQYLEETILSVVRQGYPRLQYIVVDGASTDGSDAVIARHRAVIDIAIIEPDRGQTHAINKGLALARGEILTWLNSDDMLAPGALHMMALEFLRTDADLVFGFCLPHRARAFQLANLPAVRQDSFDMAHLADIFTYWMRGFFFYQPEVFFTRRILDAAGGTLREDLHYTMDYEFWLRCAAAGARVAPLAWPIALFRQHDAQKTANLVDCMLEQAEVRDSVQPVAPPPERRREVAARIGAALARPQPRIAIVSGRLGKIFSPLMAEELAAHGRRAGLDLHLVQRPDQVAGGFDAMVKLVHLQRDAEEIAALRAQGFTGPVLGWFWDNHHHLFANHEVVEALDVSVPGHAFARHYLAHERVVAAEPVPLCVTQWSPGEADAFWAQLRDAPRQDVLYGGFVRYAFARKRNTLIAALIEAGNPGVYFVDEARLERYFNLSREDRFADWAAHKASITLPLARDLSQRLFDALLTGQVPVVPTDVVDLDSVISPAMQARLPIIRFDRYDVASVAAAHAAAIAAFDAGGREGAEARHRFARDNHMMDRRVDTLVARLREAGRGGLA